ncbi:hypothetical protein [Flavobacterium sp.]|jgi:hypothetical protein|uniref:hypothetical protein n=1 Tax=Flavobacterium sp. TaxID=239 RepID=UPI0037C002FE
MIARNKLYLFLSIFSFLFLIIGMFKSFEKVTYLGVIFDIIWIPIFTLTLTLPFLNSLEIIKNNDQLNLYYWIALVFNVISMIFILRYFGLGLL